MAKFHINSKGVPAPCKATKGKCPFGGAESHYDSIEIAQAEADKKNAMEFGSLSMSKPISIETRNQIISDIAIKVAGSIDNVHPRSIDHMRIMSSKEAFKNDSDGVNTIVEYINDKKADKWDTHSKIQKHLSYYFPKTSEDDEDDDRYYEERENLNMLAADNLVYLKEALEKTNDEFEIRDYMAAKNIDSSVKRVMPMPASSTKENAEKASKVFVAFALNDKFHKYADDFHEAIDMYERNENKLNLSEQEKRLAFNLAKVYHKNNALKYAIPSNYEEEKRYIEKMADKFKSSFHID